MALAYDASSAAATGANATSLTFAHTCTGSNRVLIVGVHINLIAGADPTGVTYNGVAMTKIDTVSYGGGAALQSIWVLFMPSTGANNIIITCASASSITAGGISLTGASSVAGAFGHATSTSTTPTVSFSSTLASSWIIDSVGINDTLANAGTPVANGSQVSRYSQNSDAGTGVSTVGSSLATTTVGSYTMSWTITSKLWGTVAVEILPLNNISVADTQASSDAVTSGPGVSVADTQANTDSVKVKDGWQNTTKHSATWINTQKS